MVLVQKELKNAYIGDPSVWDYATSKNYSNSGSSGNYHYGVVITPKINCQIVSIEQFAAGNGYLSIGLLGEGGAEYYDNSTKIINLDTPYSLEANRQYFIRANGTFYWSTGENLPVQGENITFNYSKYSGGDTQYTNMVYMIKGLCTQAI